MKQTAQVVRIVASGYVEVKVRRISACASAHNCSSCDHCSFMENAPEITVVAEDTHGARVGDTVTVETASARVLGAAALLYIVPLLLFFLGYFIGGSFGWAEGKSIALGGGGFLLGLLGAFALDRRMKKRDNVTFKVVSVEG